MFITVSSLYFIAGAIVFAIKLEDGESPDVAFTKALIWFYIFLRMIWRALIKIVWHGE